MTIPILNDASLSMVERQVKLQHLGYRFIDTRNTKGRVLYTTITTPTGQQITIDNKGHIEVIPLAHKLARINHHLHNEKDTPE